MVVLDRSGRLEVLAVASLFAAGCAQGPEGGAGGSYAMGDAGAGDKREAPAAEAPAAGDSSAAPRLVSHGGSPGDAGEGLAQQARRSWDGDGRSLGGAESAGVGSSVFAGSAPFNRKRVPGLSASAQRRVAGNAPPMPALERNREGIDGLAAEIPAGPVLVQAYFDFQNKAYGAAYAVLDRMGWGARPRKGSASHQTPYRVTVHHTMGHTTDEERATARAVKGIQDYHMYGRAREGKEAFSDIGYHFLIDSAGRVVAGRPTDTVGAHALGENTGNIGVALLGDFNKNKPTDAQFDSLTRLIAYLALKYDIDPYQNGRLVGHGHLTATTCPGARLRAMLDPLRDAVAKEKDHLDGDGNKTVFAFFGRSRPLA